MKKWSTAQMIEKLRVGEQAEYKLQDNLTDHHLVVQKMENGAIVIVKNGPHEEFKEQPLMLNAQIMSYFWVIIPHYVTFEEAMQAHRQGKTVTFHIDEELTYTFKKELETGQFTQLANDSICLYELIEGKWTIDY